MTRSSLTTTDTKGSAAASSASSTVVAGTRIPNENLASDSKYHELVLSGQESASKTEAKLLALQSICSKIFKQKDLRNLSTEQLFDFCMERSKNLFAGSDFNPGHDTSALLRLAELSPMSDKQKQAIYSVAIETRLNHFHLMALQHRHYDTKTDQNDVHYLTQAVASMGQLLSVQAAHQVVNVLGKVTFSRHAGTETDVRRSAAAALENICSSAKSVPDVFEYLVHCIPFIRTISSAPVAGNEVRSEMSVSLNRAIGHLIPKI